MFAYTSELIWHKLYFEFCMQDSLFLFISWANEIQVCKKTRCLECVKISMCQHLQRPTTTLHMSRNPENHDFCLHRREDPKSYICFRSYPTVLFIAVIFIHFVTRSCIIQNASLSYFRPYSYTVLAKGVEVYIKFDIR